MNTTHMECVKGIHHAEVYAYDGRIVEVARGGIGVELVATIGRKSQTEE